MSKYQVDDIIHFGKRDWIVLKTDLDRILILSKDVVEERQYNVNHKEITWEECTLQEYLNHEFLHEKFSEEEQEQILEATLENPDNTLYDSGTEGGNDTKDRFFCLV